jgi:hypothetical protein
MAQNISEFRQQFKGTRPNRFKMDISGPVGNLGGVRWDLYGKATSIPNQQIGVIPVPWMGRIIKFSGERVFPDWTVQLYDSSDRSSDARNFFMQWLEAMNTAESHDQQYNLVGAATVNFDDFGGDQKAEHGNQGSWNRGFFLKHVFPIDVGPLEFSYDSSDSFSEFTVTFAYDYLEYSANGPATVNGGPLVGPPAP